MLANKQRKCGLGEHSNAAIIYSEFLLIFNEAEGWVGVGTYEACKCPLVYFTMYVYTQKHNKFQKWIKEITSKRFRKIFMPLYKLLSESDSLFF